MSRSTFTAANGYIPDVFAELFDLNPSQIAQAQRYQELKMNPSKTTAEIQEFNTLSVALQNYIISPERWNHFADALWEMQNYMKTSVFDHVDAMKKDTKDYVDAKKIEMDAYSDGVKNQVQVSMLDAIQIMEDKKDLFIAYVNIKQSEVHALVQTFDSRTMRYYQRWSATAGQVIYNIYAGDIPNLPAEAKLMFDEKDIDVVVQGTRLTPIHDYEIVQNGNFDSIELKGSAAALIAAGTEITAFWYKNAGKLYFSHAPSHELGGSDEIKNIQEPQLNPVLANKINSGNITISSLQPSSGLWYKVI